MMWEECTWPFDGEYAKKVNCWRYKVQRGYIYLTDSKRFNFLYTVSVGDNSQYSWSGCHTPDITTVEQAKSQTLADVNKANGWNLQ